MSGIRYKEKVARETVFLDTFKKLDGSVIIRPGKEISIPVEVEGQIMYVGVTFATKRIPRGETEYNPHMRAVQMAQKELEDKVFGKKKKAAKVLTMTDYFADQDDESCDEDED